MDTAQVLEGRRSRHVKRKVIRSFRVPETEECTVKTQRKGPSVLLVGEMKSADASAEDVRLWVVILVPCIAWSASLDTSSADGTAKKGCIATPRSGCFSLAV